MTLPLTVDWPIGEISWAFTTLIAIIAVTYLIARGFLQNAEIDVGDKGRIIFGAKANRPPTKQQQAMLAMAQMTEEKYQKANEIKAQQKRAIEDYYEKFMDALHDADYMPAELLWRHFTDPLVNAAEENHILSYLDGDGNLKPSYIAEKMIMVQTRHARMVSKKKGCLPDWSSIEKDLNCLMAEALHEFAEVAKKGWQTFRVKVESVRMIAPKMGFLLDRLVDNV